MSSLVKNNKKFHLIAPSVSERDDWVSAIHRMIAGQLKHVKHGTLLKLGGRSKERWEQRTFTVKPSGIVWSAKSTEENTLRSYEMYSVSELHDDEVTAHEEATLAKEDALPPVGADRDTPNKRVQRWRRATTATHAPNTAFRCRPMSRMTRSTTFALILNWSDASRSLLLRKSSCQLRCIRWNIVRGGAEQEKGETSVRGDK